MYDPKDETEAIFRAMFGTPRTKEEILWYNKHLAKVRRQIAKQEETSDDAN